MSDDYLSKAQVDAIKVDIRNRIVKALTDKGHNVDVPEGIYIRSVDGQHVPIEFRSWGEPRYSQWHTAQTDKNYARSVQVTVEDGTYRRGCDHKVSRRTKAGGVLPEADLTELVLAIENVVNYKVNEAKAEVEAKSSRDKVLEFLNGNGIEIKYGESYVGEKYKDGQGKLKVGDTGGMTFSLYVHSTDFDKAQKVINFIRELNLEAAHEAGMADSEAA